MTDDPVESAATAVPAPTAPAETAVPASNGSGPNDLPPLPTLGAVTRRPPATGARRPWQEAVVLGLADETPTARTFRLGLPAGSQPHVPGQHYVVRVPGPHGVAAQRSYSVASAPLPVGRNGLRVVELTVERIGGGSVSPYLHDVLRVGDRIDLRGPFGGWFIWQRDTPALLIGGGSGVVPLMAMVRHWRAGGRRPPLRLLVSVRGPEDVYYRRELGAETTVVSPGRRPRSTRGRPDGSTSTSCAPC